MSTKTRGADRLSTRANKLELLERLADNLAHEIKNPLHSMVINLEVLKRRVARYGQNESDELLRYIGVLGGELERVNKRIELLLRLTRPGRGSELTTLNELVEELIELIQLEAARREIITHYEPVPPPARVRVPREPMRQVILNLVLEALDALDGGDSLTIRVEQEDDRAVLLVEAIPAATVPSGTSTGRGRTGTGGEGGEMGEDADLRLEVARRLAESVGGRVRCRDAPNGNPRGNALSFILTLPVPSA